MRPLKPLLSGSALAAAMLAATPQTAAAETHSSEEALGLLASGFEYIVRTLIQGGVMAARSQVEITYGDIVVDVRSGTLAITDLRVLPETPFSEPGECVVTVGRFEIVGESIGDFGEARIDLSDLALTPTCIPEEPRAMAGGLGYETLGADFVSIQYDYDVGSSALNATVTAALTDIAELQAEVAFDYFWFTAEEGFDPDSPPTPGEPVADLAFAEIVLSDAGGLERARPMLEAMIGDLSAAPAMAKGGVMMALTNGGQTQATPEQDAFATDLSAAVEGLLAGSGDLVVTIDPEPSVRLGPELFFAPDTAFAALSPSASGRVAARRGIVPADLLNAALNGGSVSDEERMAAGAALASGVGAPLAPELARKVLEPLIEAWNGDAAMIAARSYAPSNALDAYGYALVACAGGVEGAAGFAEALEGRLSVDDILEVQSAADEQWPGGEAMGDAMSAAIRAGDTAALRRLARAAANGDGRPRDHLMAYGLASLAAAGGDRAAAALRDRVARRFNRRSGDDAAAWSAAASEIESQVMAAWLEGGLADRLGAE